MAGSMVAVASEPTERSVTAIGDQWEVQYSRFFNYPSISSSLPTLRDASQKHRSKGNWISSSSTASLKLLPDLSSKFILTVTLLGRILEEHYISKLHFTWPHVSCMSGFPTRGSRAVFISYRDCAGQIQKFALRFSTICETKAFVNALKEIMEDVRDIGLPCGNSVSEISSQSEFVPFEELPYRPKVDWSSKATHQMQSSLNYEVAQSSNSQETALNHDLESIVESLPPSFTSLLMGCHPVVEQAASQPTASGDIDIKFQIQKYMEDSSFQDMLCKVEKVMSEIGDNLLL